MRGYAYGIFVGGKKRVGGLVHADSMEDAVRRAARRNNLTISRTEHEYTPDTVSWIFRGDKASVYVWAPPEYF